MRLFLRVGMRVVALVLTMLMRELVSMMVWLLGANEDGSDSAHQGDITRGDG